MYSVKAGTSSANRHQQLQGAMYPQRGTAQSDEVEGDIRRPKVKHAIPKGTDELPGLYSATASILTSVSTHESPAWSYGPRHKLESFQSVAEEREQ